METHISSETPETRRPGTYGKTLHPAGCKNWRIVMGLVLPAVMISELLNGIGAGFGLAAVFELTLP